MKRLLAILLLACTASCATYDAVVSAPPETWMALEKIGIALVTDLKTIIGFFLPI